MIRLFAMMAMIATLTTITPPPSSALDFPIGPRAGYTSWDGIKQFHFGAHAKLGDLFPNVALTPNVELGFGDGFTIVTINGDLAYRFTELTSEPWDLYGGGSLSLNYLNHDQLDGNLDLGLSGLVGVIRKLDNGNEVLGEIRIGILDSPSFKITCGYTFF